METDTELSEIDLAERRCQYLRDELAREEGKLEQLYAEQMADD